jgi:hypothetical protein
MTASSLTGATVVVVVDLHPFSTKAVYNIALSEPICV